MNKKTISEFDFRIIWRIMEISGVLSTLLDLHNYSDDAQHSIIIVKYYLCRWTYETIKTGRNISEINAYAVVRKLLRHFKRKSRI